MQNVAYRLEPSASRDRSLRIFMKRLVAFRGKFAWFPPLLALVVLLGGAATAQLSCNEAGNIVQWDAGPDAPMYDRLVEPEVHPSVQVTMNANDIGGSGTNTHETILNVTNV